MSRFTRAASPAALLVSVAALTISLSAGGAYAAVLVGTAQLKNSSVTSAKIKDKTIQTKDLSLAARAAVSGQPGPKGDAGPAGPAGAQGPAGAAGAKGDPGAAATSTWAFVKTDGTLARSSGTTSSSKLNTGTYEVVFNRDVTQCVYQATLSDNGVTGFAEVDARSGKANGVYIATYDTSGALSNAAFYLTVFC